MNQQNQQNEPERSFESLNFYQDTLKLLKASYRLAGDLPNYERYNLTDQLRRASILFKQIVPKSSNKVRKLCNGKLFSLRFFRCNLVRLRR